jgi:hypothetical protein
MQLSVKLPNLKVKRESQMPCHILFEKLYSLTKIPIFFNTTLINTALLACLLCLAYCTVY